MAILTAGITASATPLRDFGEGLRTLGVVGLILLVSGVLAVVVCASVVAWPIKTGALLDPARIIENYVQPKHELRTPAWVHQRLSADLRGEYGALERIVKMRNGFYKCAIAAIPVVVTGALLVWLDGRI